MTRSLKKSGYTYLGEEEEFEANSAKLDPNANKPNIKDESLNESVLLNKIEPNKCYKVILYLKIFSFEMLNLTES